MNKLRELEHTRSKKLYNLMSEDIFNLMNPKQEIEIHESEMKLLKWLKNFDVSTKTDSTKAKK